MTSLKNLLFSLPDVLMMEVFAFDPTYRIYNSDVFKKELCSGWLNVHKSQLKKRICEYVLNVIYAMKENHSIVKNEYGYMGCFECLDKNERDLFEFKEETFEIYLDQGKRGKMYYKIVPKGASKENCAFLRNPCKFDGYVCHEKRMWLGVRDYAESTREDLLDPNIASNCEWSDGIRLFA